MLASTVFYIFVFLIILVILMEYINEKRYQAKKYDKRKKRTPKQPPEPLREERVSEEEPEPLAAKIPEAQPEPALEIKAEKEPETKTKVDVQPKAKEATVLPKCNYPPFTHIRLVEMGLSDEEAREFVNELISQLEEQVPLIENAINHADFDQIERLTHGIKGSATNLGTGGVSDLLVAFNTYAKSETEPDIAKAYHTHFIHYIDELKKQYA